MLCSVILDDVRTLWSYPFRDHDADGKAVHVSEAILVPLPIGRKL